MHPEQLFGMNEDMFGSESHLLSTPTNCRLRADDDDDAEGESDGSQNTENSSEESSGGEDSVVSAQVVKGKQRDMDPSSSGEADEVDQDFEYVLSPRDNPDPGSRIPVGWFRIYEVEILPPVP